MNKTLLNALLAILCLAPLTAHAANTIDSTQSLKTLPLYYELDTAFSYLGDTGTRFHVFIGKDTQADTNTYQNGIYLTVDMAVSYFEQGLSSFPSYAAPYQFITSRIERNVLTHHSHSEQLFWKWFDAKNSERQKNSHTRRRTPYSKVVLTGDYIYLGDYEFYFPKTRAERNLRKVIKLPHYLIVTQIKYE